MEFYKRTVVQVGDKIPEFSLLDQNGVKRSNKGLKSPLVLFFYPKDDTPGCTIEVCGFRDKYDLFKVLGAQVWGVSNGSCLLYTSPSPRDRSLSRMPSSA